VRDFDFRSVRRAFSSKISDFCFSSFCLLAFLVSTFTPSLPCSLSKLFSSSRIPLHLRGTAILACPEPAEWTVLFALDFPKHQPCRRQMHGARPKKGLDSGLYSKGVASSQECRAYCKLAPSQRGSASVFDAIRFYERSALLAATY